MNRIRSKRIIAVILCVIAVFASSVALAATYKNVYGVTKERMVVHESYGTSSTSFDNVVKDRCVFILQSKDSGGNTWVEIKYRNAEGGLTTGWVCQSDGDETFVKVLSNSEAKNKYGVSSGSVPSKTAGTKSAKERTNALARGGSSSSSSGTASVKQAQENLKKLGFYSGEITGNVGSKTEQAIRDFQRKYGLSVDGKLGTQTMSKLSSAAAGKSSSSSSGDMKIGSSGDRVRQLQQDLTALGFYWAEVTGSFGAKTETAVKSFQKAYGMSADGVAGTATLNNISTALKNKGYSSGSSTSLGSSILKEGSTGTAVSNLQRSLKNLGYYDAEVTGHFGSKTAAAVRAFQTRNNLVADGVAGSATLSKISSSSARSSNNNSSSSSSSVSGSTLTLNSEGAAVRSLQDNLYTLGYYNGTISGHYGSMTAEAVRKYQKKKGYAQTGNATPSLQQEIAKATGNSSSVVSGTLKKGSSGSAVTALQTALMKLGYYYGELTGNYGDLTAKAVRRYQSDHGLTADGVAGPATIASINGRTDMNITAGISTSTTGKLTAYATITGNNVTLRSGPGTNYGGVTSLSNGTTMKISRSERGKDGFTWYYGTTTNMDTRYSGYVRIDYISLMSRSVYDETTGKSSNYIGMLEVIKTEVAIREGPGKDESVAGRVDKGEQFYYKAYADNGWYQLTGSSYVEGCWISDDCVKLISWGGSGGSIYLGTLKFGDSGDAVRQLQMKLSMLGYYNNTISGTYGRLTEEAVSDFQSDHGLNDDGKAGPDTLNAIEKAISGKINTSDITVKSTVYDLPWNSVSNSTRVAYGVESGKYAKILDLATGKAFNIFMRWGTEHMDAEPYNAKATETLCDIYGVDSASQLPSDRNKARPMLVETNKGYQIVCTLYPVPHDSSSQTITNNNFNGVFCIHFTGTRTHGGNVVHSEYTNAINLAKTLLKDMDRTIKTITD